MGQRAAREEITEHLERAEQERDQRLQDERDARSGVAECQRTLDAARVRQKELSEREPTWRDLATRAEHLADKLGRSVASLPELQAAREVITQRLTEAKAHEASLVERRERLHAEARELLAAGGPFDAELLRLKDALGAELLATAFEDASLEDAGVLEAQLGPLVQALVVNDPLEAATQVHDRSESLPEVWFVGRDEDVAQLAAAAPSEDPETADVVVFEQRATRVTRIPDRPRGCARSRALGAPPAQTNAGVVDLSRTAAVLGEVSIPERAFLDGLTFEGAIRATLLVENLGAWRDLPAPPGWLLIHVPGWDTATVGHLRFASCCTYASGRRACVGSFPPSGSSSPIRPGAVRTLEGPGAGHVGP